ncbi:hypothetical protein QVD17_15443 [Tagetes erecta]|uniref:non-specific serine/threonine protein kinase n=1 Tax=Tagetes erecta TaxID=13708 RepID=A0AAD8KPU5_TARER|nr:hypothetical protein QVD17_15443 [Tagetes erecta]
MILFRNGNKTKTLNAFHIISLLEGFNLSSLFEEKKREEKEEIRFATTKSPETMVAKLESVATEMKFMVDKTGDESSLRMKRNKIGRKGRLGIMAEIWAVAPSLVVVEVKKSSGDTLEYNRFCSKQLRPALKDIVWTSGYESTPAGVVGCIN